VIPLLISELKRAGANVASSGASGSLTINLPIGGSIRGSWKIDGKSIAVEIKQRPSIVSCGQIESKLQDAILDAKNVLKQSKD